MNNQSYTADKILTPECGGKLLKLLRKEMHKALSDENSVSTVIDYFIIAITWNTGMRISEVAKLSWLDVRSEFLIVRNGKGGKTRTVFFGNKTNKLFKSCRSFCRSQGKNTVDGPVFWGRQGRLSTAQIHRRAKQWFKLSSLPCSITFHSLRHGYATRMLEEGVSLSLLRDQLGHASISVTSGYLHFTKKARKVLCKAT